MSPSSPGIRDRENTDGRKVIQRERMGAKYATSESGVNKPVWEPNSFSSVARNAKGDPRMASRIGRWEAVVSTEGKEGQGGGEREREAEAMRGLT